MNGTLVSSTREVFTAQRLRDARLRDARLLTGRLLNVLRDDQGLTTAEYAVGTVAVAGLGGVLIKLLTSDAVRDLIWTIVRGAFATMLGG